MYRNNIYEIIYEIISMYTVTKYYDKLQWVMIQNNITVCLLYIDVHIDVNISIYVWIDSIYIHICLYVSLGVHKFV